MHEYNFYGTFHMNRTFMVHCTIEVLPVFAYAKYQGLMQMGQSQGNTTDWFPPQRSLSALLAHGYYCVAIMPLTEVAFYNNILQTYTEDHVSRANKLLFMNHLCCYSSKVLLLYIYIYTYI